jgi:hypothetical protein
MRLRYLALIIVFAPPVAVLLALAALATIRKPYLGACGNCGMRKVRPSWPNGIVERALAQIGLIPYKCDGCLHRFYGWRWGNG